MSRLAAAVKKDIAEMKLKKLRAEKKRYKEALESIAMDESLWSFSQLREIARQALLN